MNNEYKMKSDNLRICIITCPLGSQPGNEVFVDDIIKVTEPLSKDLYIITHNYPAKKISNPKIHVKNVKFDEKKQSVFIRAVKQLLLHLEIAFNLIKLSNKFDIVIFYLGCKTYLLPTIVSWVLRKKIVSIVTGSGAQSVKNAYSHIFFGQGGMILFHSFNILENIHYTFSSCILAESNTIIQNLGLERFKYKIFLTGIYFNTDIFKLTQNFSDRQDIIGYVGRFNPEKGTINFVKAFPLILEKRSSVEFLIGGDGAQRKEVVSELENLGLSDKVKMPGWIPHEELYHFYNDIKILVIPSYTESVPIVAVEAMACGVVVAATAVGGVRDVITDGENGYILEDNSPEVIADSVLRILASPGLSKVSAKACNFVQNGFTYRAATERYRDIFGKLRK